MLCLLKPDSQNVFDHYILLSLVWHILGSVILSALFLVVWQPQLREIWVVRLYVQ